MTSWLSIMPEACWGFYGDYMFLLTSKHRSAVTKVSSRACIWQTRLLAHFCTTCKYARWVAHNNVGQNAVPVELKDTIFFEVCGHVSLVQIKSSGSRTKSHTETVQRWLIRHGLSASHIHPWVDGDGLSSVTDTSSLITHRFSHRHIWQTEQACLPESLTSNSWNLTQQVGERKAIMKEKRGGWGGGSHFGSVRLNSSEPEHVLGY